MRVVIVFLTLVINLVLQSTVFEYIEIIGIKPNTAILIIISYAILRGDVEGATVGFFSGLLQDIFFGSTIGICALLGMLMGYFCGKPFKDFFHENYFLPLILAGAGTFIYEFLFYCMSFLFRGKIDFFYYLNSIIIPETVYTLALSIPIYRIVYGINGFLETRESMRRKLFKM